MQLPLKIPDGPEPGPADPNRVQVLCDDFEKSVEASRSFHKVPTSIFTCSSHPKDSEIIPRPGEVEVFREKEQF